MLYKFKVLKESQKSSGNKELVMNYHKEGIKFSLSQAWAPAVAFSFLVIYKFFTDIVDFSARVTGISYFIIIRIRKGNRK